MLLRLRARLPELLNGLVAALFFFVATAANLKAALGEFVLHMDERITFGQVEAILHPESFLDAVYDIAYGGELRYGRIFFVVAALFSALPELLWGQPGQIVATRSVGAMALAVSTFLLAKIALPKSIFQFVLTAALLTLPFASYYASMPKPDSIQILALALFFFLNRDGIRLGRTWVLLGLAVGLKVSALPVVFFLVALKLVEIRRSLWSNQNLARAMFWLLVGVVVAVPPLLGPICGLLVLLLRISSGRNLSPRGLTLYSLIAIAPPILGSRILALVWSSTLGNTGHGADSTEIGFETWLGYFLTEWSGLPPVILIPAALLTTIVLTILFFQEGSEFFRNLGNGLAGMQSVILFSGLLWLVAIFLTSQRLWGMYLFPGVVLTLSGISGLLFATFKGSKVRWARTAVIVIAVLGLIGVAGRIFSSYDEFLSLYSREETSSFRGKLATRELLDGLLKDLDAGSSSRLAVAFDPNEFTPQSRPGVELSTFWGPFNAWRSSFDIILLSDAQVQNLNRCEENAELESCREFRQNYLDFVRSSPSACNTSTCWIPYSDTPSGGQILVERSLFETIE